MGGTDDIRRQLKLEGCDDAVVVQGRLLLWQLRLRMAQAGSLRPRQLVANNAKVDGPQDP